MIEGGGGSAGGDLLCVARFGGSYGSDQWCEMVVVMNE